MGQKPHHNRLNCDHVLVNPVHAIPGVRGRRVPATGRNYQTESRTPPGTGRQ
jgi:hypothetical protein